MQVNANTAEIERIRIEYERRSREIPRDFYSWNRPANFFTHCQLVRDLIAGLEEEKLYPLTGRRVADIGCGNGSWLLEFAQWGAEALSLAGIDLDESRIAQARTKLPDASLRLGSADRMPWPGEAFDVVTQFTLFSSILSQSLKAAVAREMLRILKPDGLIVWYDLLFDNPRNPNVRGIRLNEIRRLFPRCTVRTRRVTLAPPIARAVAPTSWILAAALEKLPFLRTHHLHFIRKHS